MHSLFRFAVLFLAVCGISDQARADVRTTNPKCEYLVDPVGIEARRPRFSWEIDSPQRGTRQSAYRILVASSLDKLRTDQGDKWDSGRVESATSVNIPYAGQPLASRETCFWKACVWDGDGKQSEFSPPAKFEMALVAEGDWRARWISPEESGPLVRKEIDLRAPARRARVYISGLGWFELYVNGKRVGDRVLDPVMSNYHKEVYYVTHDVADYLRPGRNCVGVMLGNGWFSQPGRTRYGKRPVLLAQIEVEYADGKRETFVTDETWKATAGPVVENAIQRGETYDARLEKPGWTTLGYDDSEWATPKVVEGPSGTLHSQLVEPIRVVADLTPISLSQPKPGIFVYDLGQVYGGWTRLQVKGDAGTKVTLQYSERISPEDGLVDKRNHPAPQETDVYILKGDASGESFEPRFIFHPVRYVQIEGYPGTPRLTDLVGRVAHSDVDLTGGFSCSNPLVNRVAHITDWTIKNCWYGMPLDCLHREPFPYLEPAETPANLYNRKFMPQLWTKWLRDVQSEQRADGAIPVVVPNYANHTSTDPAWSGCYPMTVWYLAQYYQDKQLLAGHYDSMKRWVDFLTSTADGHLVLKGTWGDHMSPGEKPGEEDYISPLSPPELLWTGTYYRDAAVVARSAAILGKSEDAAKYGKLAEDIKTALNAKWFDASTGNYAGGAQTSNAFALAVDVVPEDKQKLVAQNLIRDLAETRKGHLTTGIIGLTSLVETIGDHGGGDAFLRVVDRTEYPGWGYMISQGATSIWESWGQIMRKTRGREESMGMFATVAEFLYSDVAGLHGPAFYGAGEMLDGFAKIRIRPLALGDLQHAQATIRTTRGLVSSRWRREGNGLVLEAQVPGNCTASVSVPTLGHRNPIVREGDVVVWQGKFVPGADGVSGAASDGDFITFEVGSGRYAFRLSER